MSQQTPFPCVQCGLCCRKIGEIVETAREQAARGSLDPHMLEVAAFPFGFTPDGACEKLINNACSVYEDRPDICSVEKTHAKYHSAMPRENYFILAGIGCKVLQAEAGWKEEGQP